MGLLFHPRRMVSGSPPERSVPASDEMLSDRTVLFRAALEAVVIGDASHFIDFFTDDVVFTSPHLAVASRSSVVSAFGEPEHSLSEMDIVVHSLDVIDDKLVAEWQLDATFSQALLFDDDLLIEPTGTAVHLQGASVAEFRGSHIHAFRHYFDDSELLDEIPGVSAQLRWKSAQTGKGTG